MRYSLLVFLFLVTAPLNAALVYKWVDNAGAVHFADQPPTSGDYQTLTEAEVSGGQGSESSYERARDMREALDQRQAREAEAAAAAAQDAKVAQIRQTNCKRATKNLTSLKTDRNMLVKDENTGAMVRMPEEERLKRLADARAAVEKYCK